MLSIEGLTKWYGQTCAVEDLSLHIAPGEIFGFIGHNGAGKTTTLKCVVGILGFDAGEIRIDGLSVRESALGESVRGVREKTLGGANVRGVRESVLGGDKDGRGRDSALECKRRIAYIPDNPDLYDFMSGIKYLNFIADIFEVPMPERVARIEKYASLFEMSAVLGNPISSYSHGMKQKLAIISAWVHAPKLIIMDEPFVGLDPKASHILKGMMRSFCDEGGAIFFSTHVLEVAEKLCDKVAIIKGGKLIKCGTMDEVKGDESLEEVFLELVD